jgi:hypothetical protein
MISTKENIEEYSKLFKKYYSERIIKLNEYKQKHDIKDGESINSIDHPDYFDIDKEWDKIRNALDEPILKNAKYKINQKLEFIKTNNWHYDFFKSSRTEKVLSQGIVTQIKTSGNGSGEILYCFDVLEPLCPESNPYCLEKDVIRVLKN